MGEFRIPSEKSKYYIQKEEYLTVVHFCRQYPEWVKELSVEPDSGGAIRYDRERVQTSGNYDANAELAMRRYELARKKQLVDDAAREAAGGMAEWLVLGVSYGFAFWELEVRGIPCEKNAYYKMRRKFYFILAKKM